MSRDTTKLCKLKLAHQTYINKRMPSEFYNILKISTELEIMAH